MIDGAIDMSVSENEIIYVPMLENGSLLNKLVALNADGIDFD